ncbi:MAG: TolC family protein [Phycisphaerae bacterium]|nr:TolC family protein [Phycisphaerae bacterium]
MRAICVIPALMIAGCGPSDMVSSADPAVTLRSSVLRKIQAAETQSELDPNSRVVTSGPLTVERAVEEALVASPELEQIAARIQAAHELVKQAESNFYPRLVLSETYNTTDNPVYGMMNIINQRRLTPTTNFNFPGTQQNWSTQIGAEWMLLDAGGRQHNRNAAEQNKQATSSQLAAARNEMVASVIQTYFQWMQAMSFIEVAQSALHSARTDEKLGQSRIDAQVALKSELYRLQTATAEAEGKLVSARISVSRLQAAMERLLARRIGESETPQGVSTSEEANLKNLDLDPDNLVEKSLQQRPEIAAAAAMIRAAEERVQAARGDQIPKVSAHAWYAIDSEHMDASEDSWMAGIAATWPLFEGGASSSRIRQAQADLRDAKQRGRQIALDIALEVQQSGLAVQEAAEKIRIAMRQREYARQGLEELRKQYESQTATVDALLGAEVAWNRAQVGYTAALFEGRIVQAQLRRALGEFADGMKKGQP